jgi:hypothetical protein
MQAPNFRYLILTVFLLVGAGLYTAFGEPRGSGAPRWPDTPTLYTTDRWSAGPQTVEHNVSSGNQTDLVSRVFRNQAGATATLTLVTNQAPKLYGAGAEVPFLGNGYSVEPASPQVASVAGNGVHALIAQRGPERWLVMYAYGERRGLLGNGPLPWSLAIADGILGRPNDYYKLYLATRIDRADPQLERDVADLAQTLFPRISAWYSA